MPDPTIAEQILKELKMLNANLQKLDATMAKPRPKRPSASQVFAQYLRAVS